MSERERECVCVCVCAYFITSLSVMLFRFGSRLRSLLLVVSDYLKMGLPLSCCVVATQEMSDSIICFLCQRTASRT